jgi:hypothetical protein
MDDPVSKDVRGVSSSSCSRTYLFSTSASPITAGYSHRPALSRVPMAIIVLIRAFLFCKILSLVHTYVTPGSKIPVRSVLIGENIEIILHVPEHYNK